MSSTPSRPGRARWLKLMHEWHWVSAAISLVAMLLFTVTGITLNHAGDIEAKPRVLNLRATVDDAVLSAIQPPPPGEGGAPVMAGLPTPLQDWIHAQWGIRTAGKEGEWSQGEVYVSLPRPGGDAWLRINLDDGEAEYELTDRGWISYFNDLHKGRNTGMLWRWFIDIFAVACLIFTVTGLVILYLHAANRPMTWPITALGLLVPALLALLWMH